MNKINFSGEQIVLKDCEIALRPCEEGPRRHYEIVIWKNPTKEMYENDQCYWGRIEEFKSEKKALQRLLKLLQEWEALEGLKW